MADKDNRSREYVKGIGITEEQFNNATPFQQRNIVENFQKEKAGVENYENINSFPEGSSIWGKVQDLSKEFVAPVTYIKAALGSKQPVDMDSYPADAQEFLRYMVKNNGEGPVDHQKWADNLEKYQLDKSGGALGKGGGEYTQSRSDINNKVSVYDQFFHPINQVQNTLGRFNIDTNPETGEYRINDRFDFAKSDTTENLLDQPKWWDPRFLMSNIGHMIMPEADSFNINTGVFDEDFAPVNKKK